MAKTENVLDCEAILKRVNWSLRLNAEQMMAHIREHREDAFRMMTDPRNNGMIILGEEGVDRLWRCARRNLDADLAKKARTSLSAFVEHLRNRWAQLFLKYGKPVNAENAELWISSAYESTALEHEPATHYIPCSLIYTENLPSFAIGPVTFYSQAEFFRLHGEELDKLRETIRIRHRARVEEAIASGFPEKNAATPEQSAEWGNHLTNGLLESFKGYNWFAVVEVEAAHKEVSYDRALYTVRGALNIIKVLIGSHHTDRLRTAEDHGSAGKAATLTRDAKGELGISLSTKPMDNIAGDQWHDLLTKNLHFPILTKVLALCSTFDDPPPLCSRLLDAIAWFGDAVAERAPAAKIVKFVNAIERICGTGKEMTAQGADRGVTSMVLTRSSIIYSVITGKSMTVAKRVIGEIYECRSKLVHGSLSPFSDEVAAQVYKTDRVTNLVLFGAINYFDTLGLENRTLEENGLRAALLNLEKWQKDGRPNPSESREELNLP